MKVIKIAFSVLAFAIALNVLALGSADNYVAYQGKSDSLKNIIDVAISTEDKLAAILLYCEYFSSDNPKEVVTYGQIGLDLLAKEGDIKSEAALLRNIGSAQFRLGDMEESLSNLNQALSKSTVINDSLNIGRTLLFLSTYYYILGDYKQDRIYAEKAMEIAKKIDDVETHVESLNNIAINYQSSGDYLRSLEVYNQIFEICDPSKLDCRKFKVNKARSLHNLGELSEALALFLETKREYQEVDDYQFVAIIDHHIGYLLRLTGLYDEALVYYNSVNAYFSEQGDVNQLSVINENLGELMLSLNKPDEARSYLKKSLAIKKNSGIKTIGTVLIDIAETHFIIGQLDSTKHYLDQSVQVFETLKDTGSLAIAYNRLARYHLEKNEATIGVKYAQKALEINKRYQLTRRLFSTYVNLVALYEKQKRFDLALAATKELEVLNEDLKGSQELLKITRQVVAETLRENSGETQPKPDTYELKWYYLLLFAFIIIILLGILLSRKKKATAAKAPPKKDQLQSIEAEHLTKKLKEVMSKEALFLNEELTLKELAEAVDTSDKKISILLNQHLQTNFYDYLNKLRIEAFISKLESEAFNNYSIVGLAGLCGFKSKSSFYRIFNKEMGISPSAYKSKLLESHNKGETGVT